MMTQRNELALTAVVLAPVAIALICDALQLDGPVRAALAGVTWVGCVAACVWIWVGWRAR